jgi:hypothetical protein
MHIEIEDQQTFVQRGGRMNFRFRLLPLFAVVAALVTLAPSARGQGAAETGTAEVEEEKGFLGGYLAQRPRTPQPWHRYGTFYYNVGVGAAMYGDHTEANNDGSLSGIDASDTGFAWNVRAGFAGRYVGAEVGWVDLGEAKFDAVSDGTGNSWVAGDVSAEVEGSGWSLAGLLRIPIKDRWVMLARVGMLGWSTTETFTETSGGNTFTSTDENSGSSALYGVGFEYDIYNRDHFWIVTEFTRAQVDDDELPVNMFSGGIVYHY